MDPGIAVVLERRQTADGELVLRRAGGHLELIMNGVFLMSTSNGASERELVRAARPRGRLLIGGLGAGFSLAEAAAAPQVRDVVVVESEADVIAWGDTYFRPYNEGALANPKVTVIHADLADYLRGAAPGGFDGICLDTDNGPGWLSKPGNAALYSEAGLGRLRDLLAPGGRLAVWAAHESGEFAVRLGKVFGSVAGSVVGSVAGCVPGIVRVPVERGPDDVIYVADRLMS
jgi:spermidine synthase